MILFILLAMPTSRPAGHERRSGQVHEARTKSCSDQQRQNRPAWLRTFTAGAAAVPYLESPQAVIRFERRLFPNSIRFTCSLAAEKDSSGRR